MPSNVLISYLTGLTHTQMTSDGFPNSCRTFSMLVEPMGMSASIAVVTPLSERRKRERWDVFRTNSRRLLSRESLVDPNVPPRTLPLEALHRSFCTSHKGFSYFPLGDRTSPRGRLFPRILSHHASRTLVALYGAQSSTVGAHRKYLDRAGNYSSLACPLLRGG